MAVAAEACSAIEPSGTETIDPSKSAAMERRGSRSTAGYIRELTDEKDLRAEYAASKHATDKRRQQPKITDTSEDKEVICMSCLESTTKGYALQCILCERWSCDECSVPVDEPDEDEPDLNKFLCFNCPGLRPNTGVVGVEDMVTARRQAAQTTFENRKRWIRQREAPDEVDTSRRKRPRMKNASSDISSRDEDDKTSDESWMKNMRMDIAPQEDDTGATEPRGRRNSDGSNSPMTDGATNGDSTASNDEQMFI